MLIQVVNFTSQVYYLWITKRKKNDSDKDDIDMWSDSDQGANLHQATLASMQGEIDSLKEQLTKANKVLLKNCAQYPSHRGLCGNLEKFGIPPIK